MKKRFFAVLILAVYVLQLSIINVFAEQENYITGGDFEDMGNFVYGTGAHSDKIVGIENNSIKAVWPQHSYIIKDEKPEIHSGEGAVHIVTPGQYYSAAFEAVLKCGSMYKFSAWVKLAADSTASSANLAITTSGGAWVNEVQTYIAENGEMEDAWEGHNIWGSFNKHWINFSKEEWTKVERIIYVSESETKSEIKAWLGLPAYAKGLNYYIDDVSLTKVEYEIETAGDESVVIPVYGEEDTVSEYNVSLKLDNDSIPVKSSDYTIALADDYHGVDVQDNRLIVTSDAYEQTVILLVKYSNKAVSLEKPVPIELVFEGEKNPQARNAVLHGAVLEGNSLNVQYDYYDPVGVPEGESEIEWQGLNTQTNEWENITDEQGNPLNGKEINITQGFKYDTARAVITVKNAAGMSGDSVTTNVVIKPTAPTASKAEIKGLGFVGETLSAFYEYNDINFDAEGESIYQWYRADSENGEYKKIDGENKKEYIVKSEDAFKYIKFGVTPVSTAEPFTGEEVFSNVIAGPIAPKASNVTVTRSKSGNILTGNYIYSHEKNVKEGQSGYKWYLNGQVVCNEITYTVPSGISGTVYFEVIPVAEKEPFEGESVKSASLSVNTSAGGSSSGKGSGGTGGNGGIKTAGKVSQSETILTNTVGEEPVEIKKDSFLDISNHWAKDYINELAEAKIINGVDSENFNPNGVVTRAEFAAMVYRAFGIEKFVGEAMFEDVSENDWYFEAIQSIAAKGIVNGDGVSFIPQNNIARQEAAKIIWGIMGLETSDETKQMYEDSENINEWAKQPVSELTKRGILTGSNGHFRPLDNMTRAEAAVVISKTLSAVK